jgi:predicted  nucleic acid-binding Zn-ribbon protein
MMFQALSDAGIDAKLTYEVIRDLLIFAALFYGWIKRGRAANKSEIEAVRVEATLAIKTVRDDHEERLDRHSEKLTQFEERMKAMPKHDDLQHLHNRISKVNTTVGDVKTAVAGVDATLKAVQNSVNLLNRHHINGGAE